jgi:phage shock protein C
MENVYLRRNTANQVVAGVASGLAAALKVDPVIVRLAFVILALLNGVGVVIYLAMWLIVPRDQSSTTVPVDQLKENVGEMRDAVEGAVQRVRSFFATV